jgi:DNA topoisomerase IB
MSAFVQQFLERLEDFPDDVALKSRKDKPVQDWARDHGRFASEHSGAGSGSALSTADAKRWLSEAGPGENFAQIQNHYTTQAGARSLLADGVDLENHASPGMFGDGFYTTDSDQGAAGAGEAGGGDTGAKVQVAVRGKFATREEYNAIEDELADSTNMDFTNAQLTKAILDAGFDGVAFKKKGGRTPGATWAVVMRPGHARPIDPTKAKADKPEQEWARHHGQFAPEEGGSPETRAGFHAATADERKRMALPPAWTDVQISDDPTAPLQVVAKDGKGRAQYRYSQEHMDKQAVAKFKRTQRLNARYRDIERKLLAQAKTGDERALGILLIARTGMRPGSTEDTGADKQAFGASTLHKEHVKFEGDTVRFTFTGKGGKQLDLTLEDGDLSDLLRRHLQNRAGDTVFGSSAAQFRDHLAAVAPGFKLKDLRTRMGTEVARQQVASLPAPKTARELSAQRRRVAQAVSNVLGNTPTIALQSYVDPTVFAEWERAVA